MKSKFHKNLTLDKWQQFSKTQQILNIAAEFSRAKNWLSKNQLNEASNALERAFELIDLTINAVRHQRTFVKELLRLRDVLAQFYIRKDKNIREFIKIFKTLLSLDKFASQVRI